MDHDVCVASGDPLELDLAGAVLRETRPARRRLYALFDRRGPPGCRSTRPPTSPRPEHYLLQVICATSWQTLMILPTGFGTPRRWNTL